MPTDFPDYAQASNPPFPITSIAKASSPQSVNVPLPVGTLAISLTVGSPLALELLTVTGHVSAAPYSEALSTGIFLNYPTQWLIIDPVDTSVDIEVQFASDLDFLYVGGSFAPVAVALNVNEDVLAQLVDSLGTNLGSFTYPPGGLDDSQKILATGHPLPLYWEGPNQLPARINQSIGTAGTFQLVAPPGAGVSLWLHTINVDWNEEANAFGTFAYGPSSASVTPFHTWQMGGGGGAVTTGVGKSYPIPLHGVKLPLNNGLYVVVAGTASGQTMGGSVVYAVG